MSQVEEQGFAKLLGSSHSYIINHLQTKLGRLTNSRTYDPLVDWIPLGTSKNISREHAAICWNQELRAFHLFVYGKNGVEVDSKFLSPSTDERGRIRPGGPERLRHKSRIRVESEEFFFLFPINAVGASDDAQ